MSRSYQVSYFVGSAAGRKSESARAAAALSAGRPHSAGTCSLALRMFAATRIPSRLHTISSHFTQIAAMSSTAQSLPSSMKAIQIQAQGGPEVIELRDVPVPKPGPGQVLIRVEHAGVNFIGQSSLPLVSVACGALTKWTALPDLPAHTHMQTRTSAPGFTRSPYRTSWDMSRPEPSLAWARACKTSASATASRHTSAKAHSQNTHSPRRGSSRNCQTRSRRKMARLSSCRA